MPQIAPMIVPKIISLIRVLSKTNCPSSKEKTKKAKIVKRKPIKSPFIIPFSFTFLIPNRTPRKMETPFITWFTGAIKFSEILVKRRRKAKNKMAIRETQREIKTPFITGFNIFPLPFSLVLNIFAFSFIINSFHKKYTLSKFCNITINRILQI